MIHYIERRLHQGIYTLCLLYYQSKMYYTNEINVLLYVANLYRKFLYLHALLFLDQHCAIYPHKLEVGIYPTTPT